MSDFPITIYHNPNCGTSRNALAMVRTAGYEPTVVECLKAGWTRPLLQMLLHAMRARGNFASEGVMVMTLVRKGNGTGWYGPTPGHGKDQPTARGGGVPGQGAGQRSGNIDPKHVSRTIYAVGQGRGEARPTQPKEPSFVSHADRRVDVGRRTGDPKGKRT
jgi:hypothetical protein